MSPQQSTKAAAESEVETILEHVRSDFEHNEDFGGLNFDSTPVYHYVVSGSHVDPDLGREYVPLNEPVNSYRRRKISQRNNKVRGLVAELIESLKAGKPVQSAQEELNKKQTHNAVHLAASPDELRMILTAVFEADECMPGCLDGGYCDFVGEKAIIYGWEEALPCEGGVTDRYSEAEMQRQSGSQ